CLEQAFPEMLAIAHVLVGNVFGSDPRFECRTRFEDFLGIILTGAGRYREALASYAKMATVPPWSLVCLTVCHAELGETRQAEAGVGRVSHAILNFLALRSTTFSKRKFSMKTLPSTIATARSCSALTRKNELHRGYGRFLTQTGLPIASFSV